MKNPLSRLRLGQGILLFGIDFNSGLFGYRNILEVEEVNNSYLNMEVLKMTLSELDKIWNEIITLLWSDDPEEKARGEVLEKQFYINHPQTNFISDRQ